ncbi:septal ring lytic transglycosylase RlpA family protein [Dechloromonas sp. A34]|uniref:septal ring lytic transglycosylase RlpA family protein n=1 Tax=Dechloromonas sp. A34 TaxID=447588 RepID=UPI0022489D81|nr:septal ring lytic transglycosylase RlpA family protein [Dechloromonas sp. A34]
MTKRRPSWSKWQWRVAALACGLLLFNVSSEVWATGKKPSAKPAVSKKIKAPPRHARRVATPEVAIGSAEVLDAERVGLHGHASYYGSGFQGRKTSTGERFDIKLFTAASNRFPLGTMVAVRRLDSERCAIVKINDRMAASHRRRIIDVSRGVAEYLDMLRAGVVLVRVAKLKGDWQARGAEACHAAFEADDDCVACGRPPRLPDFGESNGG